MTHCIKCHRPLKHPTASGMGRVCEKRAAPIPPVERDLFGYDIAKAVERALDVLRVRIEFATWQAMYDIRRDFAAARRRYGVWSA